MKEIKRMPLTASHWGVYRAEVENGELNLTSFRNVSGIGRNLSIEVLEFFDKVGFTKRLAEGRFIIKPAKKAFL